jgi:hypothetical protein
MTDDSAAIHLRAIANSYWRDAGAMARDPEPTYSADWTCNGCGRPMTLSPGEASCCGRGVTKIEGH